MADYKEINLTLALPPRQLSNQKFALKQRLEELRMKNIPEIGGVLLDFKDLTILDESGFIIDDQPFVFWRVNFNGHIFKLEEAIILRGKIQKLAHSFLIAKAFDRCHVTVTIAEHLVDHLVCKNFTMDQDVFFRMTNVSGNFRGLLDDECLDLIENYLENSKDQNKDYGLFDFGETFEY